MAMSKTAFKSAPEKSFVFFATAAASSSCMGLSLRHDLDDRRARGLVGRRDEEDAVEAAGAAEGGVEMPRGVGRAEDEQAVVVADVAVHLGEELVDERAAGAALEVVAVGGERVHFVEEKHRGRMGAGEFEELRAGFSRSCRGRGRGSGGCRWRGSWP